MDLTLQLLDGNSGRAAIIWLALIVLALIALVGLALPRGVRRPRQISAWLADSATAKRAEMERRAAEAQEVVRYAEEIAVAASGATATAERRREECQQAQVAVEKAWQAWRDADAALERARRATAYALPESTSAAESDDDRVQALRRAAQAAHRRGDISDEQLLDALTNRNGWNAMLHPVEQELVLARATVEHRFAAYQLALTFEDAAWQAADVATAAIRTLRTEVVAAQARADAAREALPEQARAILDQAGSHTVVVTTQRITAETVAPQRPGTLLESLTEKPAVADVVMAMDAVVTMPIQRSVMTEQSSDTTVVMTTAAAQAAAASSAEATQEVRAGRSRRELPGWAQPTAARPVVAGAR